MATHEPSGITIKRGDNVEIKAMGMTVTGTVISADCSILGKTPNWMIEISDTNGTYRYWKQQYDGGAVRVLKQGR